MRRCQEAAGWGCRIGRLQRGGWGPTGCCRIGVLGWGGRGHGMGMLRDEGWGAAGCEMRMLGDVGRGSRWLQDGVGRRAIPVPFLQM